MAFESSSTMLGEDHSTMGPPCFNNINYSYWRTKMKLFIQANNYEVWRVITNRPSFSKKRGGDSTVPKEQDERDEIDMNMDKLKTKVMPILFCSLKLN